MSSWSIITLAWMVMKDFYQVFVFKVLKPTFLSCYQNPNMWASEPYMTILNHHNLSVCPYMTSGIMAEKCFQNIQSASQLFSLLFSLKNMQLNG